MKCCSRIVSDPQPPRTTSHTYTRTHEQRGLSTGGERAGKDRHADVRHRLVTCSTVGHVCLAFLFLSALQLLSFSVSTGPCPRRCLDSLAAVTRVASLRLGTPTAPSTKTHKRVQTSWEQVGRRPTAGFFSAHLFSLFSCVVDVNVVRYLFFSFRSAPVPLASPEARLEWARAGNRLHHFMAVADASLAVSRCTFAREQWTSEVDWTLHVATPRGT